MRCQIVISDKVGEYSEWTMSNNDIVYDLDLQAIREETDQRFNQIISIIQHNPKLAHVSPEALAEKNIEVRRSLQLNLYPQH